MLNVVLVSTYDLGRQPFGLASAAAWLKQAGASVACVDASVEKLGRDALANAGLIALYLPMHTATRLAVGLIGRIKHWNPGAHICCFGLYAPINEAYLRKVGADTVLGGEFEAGLVSLASRLKAGAGQPNLPLQPEPVISLARQKFLIPDRSLLPGIDRYAKLQIAPAEQRTVGYTEATRGCKHLCRHCPVVPVYNGVFRVVPRDVVLDDVRQQVAAGAKHITFGDPDFFNGPGHGLALVEALHAEFPGLTYDVTIKVEHLLHHSKHLPILRRTGCLFVTTAVESFDNRILAIFEKQHTREDFAEVVRLFRSIGLGLHPTFVPFTPWTTLEGYVEFLDALCELELIDEVSPIQYAIRLLITASSRLLELDETRAVIGGFDEEKLVYCWENPVPRVDQLSRDIMDSLQEGLSLGENRRQIFGRAARLALDACESSGSSRLTAAPPETALPAAFVPHLTEPWYC